jgi:predicted PurR-regulated permease PerM
MLKKDKALNIGFTVFLISLVFLAFYTIKPFFTPILWSVIAIITFYPAHQKLSKSLKSENLSAFIITAFILLIIIIPFSTLGVVLIQQGINLVQNLNAFIFSLDQQKFYLISKKLPIIGKHITYYKFLRFLHLNASTINQATNATLTYTASFLADQLKNMIFFVGHFMLGAFVFLMSTFFMLRDWDKFIAFTKDIIPISARDFDTILSTVYSTVLSVVYGFVGVAIIQAFLGFFMYYYLTPDYALVLSFATFISSFIPPIGTPLVWVPYALYIAYKDGLIYSLGVFVYSSIFIIGTDNFIRPLLMKKAIHIPYILLSLSVLGGLFSMGFLGMFMGPIVFATLITALNLYKEKLS